MMMEKYKTVCAWCGKVTIKGQTDEPVSHSICMDCMALVLNQIEEFNTYKAIIKSGISKARNKGIV